MAAKTFNVTARTAINLNGTPNHIHANGARHTNSGPSVTNGIGLARDALRSSVETCAGTPKGP